MADVVEEAGFWLPSEFFTDDDFLMEKENFVKDTKTDSVSQFCFPTEFPYDFLGTETEELLEKRWRMSTSPQSTLAHLGSWSSKGSSIAVPSPPTTPLCIRNDAVGDLVYRAAGQLAKLRLREGDVFAHGPTKLRGLLGPPRGPAQLHPPAESPNSVFQNKQFPQNLLKQQSQGCVPWGRQQQMGQNRNGRAVAGMGQAACAIRHDPTRVVCSGRRAVLLGGAGGRGGGALGPAVKRQCAGTGVFLPRRYENNSDPNAYSSDSRKRPVGSTAFVQEREVAHAFTKNLENINGCAQSQVHSQTLLNRSLISDYETLMARKHAIMIQHQRNVLLAERSMTLLPPDWTY